ncbi:MAG: YqeG family HAD IIIA-type phosphatase [Oscillospiraceae bacterium]|nr:YqeG family HAD IIIA-type phosphatase [Oscillospiraceae bacterium]
MRMSKFGANLIPDKVFTNIQDITPEWLLSRGLRGLAVDLDNTLAGYGQKRPTPDVIRWIGRMCEAGLGVVILTNNAEDRVQRFCAGLPVRYVPRARKPFSLGFKRAVDLLGLPPAQVAEVGDQIYTDVLGAKRSGLFSILVTPLHLKGHFFFSLRRRLEQPFIRKALQRDACQ